MLGGSISLKKLLVACASAALALAIGMAPAMARPHRHHWRPRHFHRHFRPIRHPRRVRRIAWRPYSPPFAAMMVDANDGHVLYAKNADQPRHPASLTKVMTLYLLFEQLAKGRMNLNTRIEVSPHAASMEPTKLGLPPGSTISVDSAIRAIVTKSANDMAVAIAEAIGGSEPHFAELMTAKARQLGMYHTQYVNASGLPNPGQLTTAHDLVILGRAIQARFPQYFHYFSTPSFRYHGQFMANHDHLLKDFPGVDGIKTGFTDASGFNLLTDLRLHGKHVVAAVLGGPSWKIRDRIMEKMLEDHLAEASTGKGGPQYADLRDSAAKPALADPAPRLRASPVAYAPVRPQLRPAQIRPAQIRPAQIRPAQMRPAQVRPAQIRPAYVASAPKAADDETPSTGSLADRAFDGSTGRRSNASGASTTPVQLHWVVGPAPAREAREKSPEARRPQAAAAQPSRKTALDDSAGAARRVGVEIQIGATTDMKQARDLLTKARFRGPRALARATPVTQKVQKGGETFWRARFAGLDLRQAQTACRGLKRVGFACFETRD